MGIPSVVRFAFCPGGALDGGVPSCAAESLLFARRETSSGHFYLPARVPRPWDQKTVGSPPGVLGQLLGPGIQYGAGRGKGSDRPQTWPSDRTRPGGSSNVEMVEIDLAVAELHAKERKTAGSPPGVLGQGVGCSPGPHSSPINTKLTGCTERHAFCRTSKFDVDRRSSQGCWVTAARSDPTAENCWVRVLGALPRSIRARSPRNL